MLSRSRAGRRGCVFGGRLGLGASTDCSCFEGSDWGGFYGWADIT